MAELLYRLGRFSARRPWTVLVAWLAALALAVGGFLAFGGTVTSSMSIPGTETERVNAQLNDRLSGLGGATGTVVFQTEDGSAFTGEQQEEISALLSDVGDELGHDQRQLLFGPRRSGQKFTEFELTLDRFRQHRGLELEPD